MIVFFFFIVPLRFTKNTLVSFKNVILWKNPSSSSTWYRIPLRYLYEKDTSKITRLKSEK